MTVSVLPKTGDNGGGRGEVKETINLGATTLLATPVTGNFEFDGTNLYFTVAGVRKTVTLV